MTYEYLETYVNLNEHTGIIFRRVEKEELESAEEIMGIEFPANLRKFYLDIGYGRIGRSVNQSVQDYYDFSSSNDILEPMHAASIFLKGRIKIEQPLTELFYKYFVPGEIPEVIFKEGELPFFEIADGSQFLIMKPLSDNPNAVYTESGILIEDSFERFIWRLYYEDPGYYCNIINCDLYKSIFKDSLKSLSPEGAAEELKEFVIRGPFPYEDIQDSVKDREKLIQRLHEEVFEEIKNAPPPPLSRSTDVYDDTNPEDHLMAWWQKDQQEALRQFTMILARDALVKRLEKGLDKIPLQVLKELMEKLLTKSDFHKAACLTLLRKRQEMTR
jgi:hypothetical protein